MNSREGKGTLTNKDGKSYTGDFAGNKKHGEGV